MEAKQPTKHQGCKHNKNRTRINAALQKMWQAVSLQKKNIKHKTQVEHNSKQ